MADASPPSFLCTLPAIFGDFSGLGIASSGRLFHLGGMSCLVFDIETSALPKEQLDEGRLEYLFRPAEKMLDEAAKAQRREEIDMQFNLWPFTAQCVCICLMNADTGRGKVLYLSDDFAEAAEGHKRTNPDDLVSRAVKQLNADCRYHGARLPHTEP